MGRRPDTWAYGVMTVPARACELLPRTLCSLERAGFAAPRLFVDGCSDFALYDSFGLEVTLRPSPAIRAHGNFVLSLWELYVRDPNASRYVIFQDDMVACKDLKGYLELCDYPARGYWNLYTFPINLQLCPENHTGWFESNQRGLGAVALVFNHEAARLLLASRYMVDRPLCSKRGWRAIDGGIVCALKQYEPPWREYVHNPSLVQHTGETSTLGNGRHELADTFRGEDFSALDLAR
jgi:hypothetical protein